jgi:hypothetical protein
MKDSAFQFHESSAIFVIKISKYLTKMKSSLIQEFSSFHQLIAQFFSEAGASSVLGALYVTSFSLLFLFDFHPIRFDSARAAAPELCRDTVVR